MTGITSKIRLVQKNFEQVITKPEYRALVTTHFEVEKNYPKIISIRAYIPVTADTIKIVNCSDMNFNSYMLSAIEYHEADSFNCINGWVVIQRKEFKQHFDRWINEIKNMEL